MHATLLFGVVKDGGINKLFIALWRTCSTLARTRGTGETAPGAQSSATMCLGPVTNAAPLRSNTHPPKLHSASLPSRLTHSIHGCQGGVAPT